MPKQRRQLPEEGHEYRPCPFCGNTYIQMTTRSDKGYKVFCNRCGAEMHECPIGHGDNPDPFEVADTAAANWNMRLIPQDRDGLDKYREQIQREHEEAQRHIAQLHREQEEEDARLGRSSLIGIHIDEDDLKEAAAMVTQRALDRAQSTYPSGEAQVPWARRSRAWIRIPARPSNCPGGVRVFGCWDESGFG